METTSRHALKETLLLGLANFGAFPSFTSPVREYRRPPSTVSREQRKRTKQRRKQSAKARSK